MQYPPIAKHIPASTRKKSTTVLGENTQRTSIGHPWLIGVLCSFTLTILLNACTNGNAPLAANVELNNRVDDTSILWQTDHETGDFREWSLGNGWLYWDAETRQTSAEGTGPQIFGEAIFNSNTPPGDCIASISKDVSRSGGYSLKLDLTGAAKATQGCRIFRTRLDVKGREAVPLPEEAYYSAWYYLPQEVETVVWWNIFQFKSSSKQAGSEAMLSFNIDSDGNGTRRLYVFHKKSDGSCDCNDSCVDKSYKEKLNTANLPLNKWFLIEAFVKQSTVIGNKVNADGALEVWINDSQIISRENICTLTRADARLQWSVNNYTDEIIPNDVLLYIDDAAISTQRIGSR